MKNKKTFEQCLELSGTEKEKAFFANHELVAQLDPDELAYKKLKVCARAWNTGTDGKVWQPNWNDSNEWKYYPWCRVKASKDKPAGFGFSITDYDYDYSYTGVGSRLCFPSSTVAMEFFDTFTELYKDYWLIPEE